MTETDLAKISDAYHNWRSKDNFDQYEDEPGFCKSVNIQEVRKNNYILTPGRYVDFKEAEDDGETFDEKMQELTAELSEQMAAAHTLDQQIKDNLAKIGYEF